MSIERNIDWDAPPKHRGNGGCKFKGCDKPAFAFLALTVRRKQRVVGQTTGRMIISRQHGYCQHHCELLWSQMLKFLEPDA